MNLKNLLVETKTAWVEYPGLEGFEVELVAQSRDKLVSLRKQCTSTKFSRSTRQPEEIVDEKKFVKMFSEAVISSWKGLKLDYLQELMLVDLKGQDVEAVLPYDVETAHLLVSNSSTFDTWLNETVFDLENFRGRTTGSLVEETGDVAA
jgi:hypothetical protein